MKYRIAGIAAMVLVLLAVFLADNVDTENPEKRVHQHLTARQPDAGCDCDGTTLCTHLPLLVIDTGGVEIPGNPITDEHHQEIGFTTAADGSTMISGKLSVMSDEKQNHHPTDAPDMESNIMIRVGGNSSRYFNKKSYRVKLVEDAEGLVNRDLPLLGMSKESDWALHGPFLDKTLIRNYMWMNISAEIMGYAPEVRFCEVILNGEYQGVYLLIETIKEGDYRVNLSDYEEGNDQTSYIVRMDALEDGNAINNYTQYTYEMEFSTMEDDPEHVMSSTGIQVLYPQAEYQSEGVLNYIQRDISHIERGLFSSDMVSGQYDYEKELDVDSFVDYYVLQEFLLNNDVFSRSTYFYRDVRGHLTVGPVWDYNNMLDNYIRPFSYDRLYLQNRGWYGALMKDEDFVERVLDRYAELRQTYLSDEYLTNYIEETLAYLGPAIARNDEVWGFSYDTTDLTTMQRRRPAAGQTLEDVNPSSHAEAVEWMVDFMLKRAEWLDENIESLRQYCHQSKTATQWVE